MAQPPLATGLRLPANWSDTARKQAFALPLLLAFITLSAGVMRAWHFFDGVTWSLPVLTASFGLQASLSIIWALTAITLMVSGNKAASASAGLSVLL